jgi:tRNA nucleotidyltransferase/poly(A) polymerase
MDGHYCRQEAYQQGQEPVLLRLWQVAAHDQHREPLWEEHYRQMAAWAPPALTVNASDLQALGYQPGPALGRQLRRLEKLWIDSDFSRSREALLAQISPSEK